MPLLFHDIFIDTLIRFFFAFITTDYATLPCRGPLLIPTSSIFFDIAADAEEASFRRYLLFLFRFICFFSRLEVAAFSFVIFPAVFISLFSFISSYY